MKINNYLAILLVFFLILTSCRKNKKVNYRKEFENTEGFKVVSINIDDEENELRMSEYIDNIDFIKLESNKDCIIGEIDKIDIDNNHIYILDKYITKSLFVFKRNGEFVKKVGRQGKGPGEYTTIWDFHIINDEKLLILDFTYNKLMLYENFNYAHSKKIKHKIQSVAENDSFFYFKLFKRDNNNDMDLLITNNEFKILKEEFPTQPNSKDAYNITYDFRNYKDSITYLKPFNYKLYRIKGEKIIPKYYFDFGYKKMTYEEANFSNSEDLNDVPFLNGDYYESDLFVIFSFVYKNYISTCLYDKISGETKHSKGVIMDIFKGDRTRFINSNEKSLFGIIEASDIKFLEESTKKKYGLTDVNEFGNPVISIAHFKK